MKSIRYLLILFTFFFVTGVDADAPKVYPPKIPQPVLPYALGALAPYISEKTLTFHYTKHHLGYAEKLNDLMTANNLADLTLEEVIKKSYNDPKLTPLFNNAAQTWNHSFYWASMKEKGGGTPTGAIKDLIEKTFGSYDDFKKQFVEAGVKQFGSGWVWLVLEKDKTLKIVTTGNADLPMVHDQKALLTCDIWEHAYYLDYQNRRKDYVEVFLDHLVDWDFANKNLEG
ncbi:MAG: superoxide dismutase [Alphaproteobacteria bacterium]|jgi:Fe-Mn family superoxide dismutase|nr:superoxide dismutase [Alphaproteobacteria bacterium]